jgi:hypothetical protein
VEEPGPGKRKRLQDSGKLLCWPPDVQMDSRTSEKTSYVPAAQGGTKDLHIGFNN